jgi:hypothetical protein
MTEDHEVEHAAGYPPGETRTTAPQQPYTREQVAAGLLVLFVGVALVVGLPLVL